MILDILLKPSIAIPIVLLLCYLVYSYLNRKSHLPDIPWVGYQSDQWFARTRCRLRQTDRLQAAAQEAYETVRITTPSRTIGNYTSLATHQANTF